MIKNRKYLYIAGILFLIAMAINFPFPHGYGEAVGQSSFFTITLTTMHGVNSFGIITLIIFLGSLYFFLSSLEKYHWRLLLAALLLFTFLPLVLISFYQNTLAKDIYAVSYDSTESHCEFAQAGRGACELVFENHSSEEVQFTIEFHEEYWFEEDFRSLSLMNNGAPYEVELKGKERRTVKIETDIDSFASGYDFGGEYIIYEISLIIYSEQGHRRL
ncbi:hypothetical protein MM300_10655 [Evansella sp. LMS18]|uniref:hypothetical protein n=1 Tax=Evansella sp. LMS18 TaxID=2924033 RepID=UPI0020D01D2F|nr:hypothetical protein [Evansella sp. LMS18]UTR12695.1 hypothetical protein MM300_10655 [Evansella sp. LMS18]